MTSSEARPRVLLIGTGGTISSIGKSSLDTFDYAENKVKLEADELLARVPEASERFDVEPVRFRAIGSPNIGIADWLELVELIHSLAAEKKPAGFVITHGTATLEETAYFLNLALKIEQPVVVVGSQRPASGLSTDAQANLLNAIRVAADEQSRGLGVLSLLNDEIHGARDVAKTSTFRLQTFRARDFGALGHADADRISYYRRPVRVSAPSTEFDLTGMTDLPRVDIAYAYAGADGAAVDAFVAAGAKGIVGAGMAPGSMAPLQSEALVRAREAGVVVVQSTRVGSGRVLPLSALTKRGFIPADNLTPQKARILLMMALTKTDAPEEIERMFATY